MPVLFLNKSKPAEFQWHCLRNDISNLWALKNTLISPFSFLCNNIFTIAKFLT